MRPNDSFIEQPIRSLQTMLRVLSEDDSRYPTVVPDGVFGPTTMNAVSVFQREHGISVTGIVDQITWEMLVQAYELALIRVDKAEPIEIIMDPGEVFRRGDSSPYIFLLQSMLTQLSFDHPTIEAPGHSGLMDDATIRSLTAFQGLAALQKTGELDKITWKHIVKQFTLNAHHHTAVHRNSK